MLWNRTVCILLLALAPVFAEPLRADDTLPQSSVEGMIEALTPRHRRGATSSGKQSQFKAAQDAVAKFAAIRARRGPTMRERAELYDETLKLPQLQLVIYFELDSDTITQQSEPTLDKLGKALSSANLQGKKLVIAGHTDKNGTAEYNIDLSERRAEAVRQYLLQRFNLAPGDFQTVGYGFEKPAEPGNPYSAKNRRVQIVNTGD